MLSVQIRRRGLQYREVVQDGQAGGQGAESETADDEWVEYAQDSGVGCFTWCSRLSILWQVF